MGTYLIYCDGNWHSVSDYTFNKFEGIKMCGVFQSVPDLSTFYIENYATEEEAEILKRDSFRKEIAKNEKMIGLLENEIAEFKAGIAYLKEKLEALG